MTTYTIFSDSCDELAFAVHDPQYAYSDTTDGDGCDCRLTPVAQIDADSADQALAIYYGQQ